jgi:thymidylate synthase
MNLIKGSTVGEAVFNAYKLLLSDDAYTTTSRNAHLGDVRCVYNTFFTVSDPRSRHLNISGRKSNIFAMIAETFWVLAGDDRVDPFLSFFLPRAADFSDDGKTWRGAYGPRMFEHDQMNGAVSAFVNDGKETRRSLVSIYMPDRDTPKSLETRYGMDKSKDIPCNNMMHFYVTPDNKFHMNLTQRSGDVIWGMGSINVFEFTLIQEMMLYYVNQATNGDIELGNYNHMVVNLHLYDKTSMQAVDAIDQQQEFLKVTGTKKATFTNKPDGNINDSMHFFSELVSVYTKFIQGDFFTPAALMLTDEVFKRYSVDTKDNIIHDYNVLIIQYIATKQGFDDHPAKVLDLSQELLSSVTNSSFRKFSI